MEEKKAVKMYMQFLRMGRCPRVEHSVESGDYLVYSIDDPRKQLTKVDGYDDISAHVWCCAQFGDILSAFRIEALLDRENHGEDVRADFRSIGRRMAEETSYNLVLSGDRMASTWDGRYDTDLRDLEEDELEGKL
jgi:hypothetical protein